MIRRPAWAAAGTAVGNAVLVGTGLAVVGIASFLSLAVVARTLDEGHFAAYATWWTSATLVGLAFSVVESYLPRLLLGARAGGADGRALVATFSRGTVGAAAVVSVLALGASPWAVDRLYGGDAGLEVLLVAYLVAMSLQSLQRAVGVGREAFTVYAAQLGSDGVVRLAGAALVAAVGVGTPSAFAAVMFLGAVTGLVVGSRTVPGWFTWKRPLAAVPAVPLGLLLVASMGPLVVNNAGVPWLSARNAPALVVGAVTGALTLSRLPTLMVGSAYGPVLTPLARAVESRTLPVFRSAHRRALGAALGLALLFTAGFMLVGPELLRVYLGDRFRLGRLELAAMAGGSGLMFACVVEQAALVAMSAWHRVALGWFLAVIGFVVALALPLGPATAVSLAVLVAPLLAVTTMAVSRTMLERPVFARPQA